MRGLSRKSVAEKVSIHWGGRRSFQHWCGARSGRNPSYRSLRTAELRWVGHTWWYSLPWMAKKPGGPFKEGNSAVHSVHAKVKTMFRIRDKGDIWGSLIKTSNSWGRGGRGGMSWRREPLGPQQKPRVSPVKSWIRQWGHWWWGDHWKLGCPRSRITQVSEAGKR